MPNQSSYPDCPNCGNNKEVQLAQYSSGAWIGFECEGCHNVVRELYNVDLEEPEHLETPAPKTFPITVSVPFELWVDVDVEATTTQQGIDKVLETLRNMSPSQIGRWVEDTASFFEEVDGVTVTDIFEGEEIVDSFDRLVRDYTT